jgi:hypothetical protein
MTTYGAVFTYFLVRSAVIVWDNGRSGFLGGHSRVNGTPTLRMNEFMLGSVAAKKSTLVARCQLGRSKLGKRFQQFLFLFYQSEIAFEIASGKRRFRLL